MEIYIVVIVVVLMMLSGLWFLLKSRGYTTVEGKITKSEIIEHYRRPGSQGAENRNTFEYEVVLEYQYTVDGTTYTGNRLYAGLPNIFPDKRSAEDIVAQYGAGSLASIYYNPSSPHQSSLLSTASFSTVQILILVGTVLFVAVIVGAGIWAFNKLDF